MARNELFSNETPAKQKDNIPHIIKYMGSKKPIIEFIISAIDAIHIPEKPICDLFAGSCSIAAALRRRYDFISNDIQDYSRVLARTYFSDLSGYDYDELIKVIDTSAREHENRFRKNYPHLFYDYSKIITLKEYQLIEQEQRALFENKRFGIDFHLFTKYYSGTYWSFEQCVWIDALRKTAEQYENTSVYYTILASIMYGMSYTTQSTGHFAQYRDGDTKPAMENILTYRVKNLYSLFKKKLKELISKLDNSLMTLRTTTLDFQTCLRQIPEKTTVYADPPYAPVHYSRFYHALETLVKYDYPQIDHKGRYRSDRHQSPFSQKTAAVAAFEQLFEGIIRQKSQMVLSYSNKGVIDIEQIQQLAQKKFGSTDYTVSARTLDHKHSTMGRFEDHEREVVEYLIIAKLT
jgi:adenine-specific DNA-methyltransferase